MSIFHWFTSTILDIHHVIINHRFTSMDQTLSIWHQHTIWLCSFHSSILHSHSLSTHSQTMHLLSRSFLIQTTRSTLRLSLHSTNIHFRTKTIQLHCFHMGIQFPFFSSFLTAQLCSVDCLDSRCVGCHLSGLCQTSHILCHIEVRWFSCRDVWILFHLSSHGIRWPQREFYEHSFDGWYSRSSSQIIATNRSVCRWTTETNCESIRLSFLCEDSIQHIEHTWWVSTQWI